MLLNTIEVTKAKSAPISLNSDPDFVLGWNDAVRNANFWLKRKSVSVEEATLLLFGVDPICGFKPDESEQLAIMRRCLADDTGGDKTLEEWIKFALEQKMPIHNWVHEYEGARPNPVTIPRVIEGLESYQIASMLDGIEFSFERWKKNLNESKWLKKCRVRPRSINHPALWCPIKIGKALLEKNSKCLGPLDRAFTKNVDWHAAWESETYLYRSK